MDNDMDVYGHNIDRRGVKCSMCKKRFELDEYAIRMRRNFNGVMMGASLCTRCALELAAQLHEKATYAEVVE